MNKQYVEAKQFLSKIYPNFFEHFFNSSAVKLNYRDIEEDRYYTIVDFILENNLVGKSEDEIITLWKLTRVNHKQ